jgi:CheY-like chemotaxis protein
MSLAASREYRGEHPVTGLRICLAEDDHDQRWALKSLLLALGHDVVCEVDDGEALIEAVLKSGVDLVITDLDMPVLDGLAAAEQIAHKRNLPIILLSGHPDSWDIVVEHEPVTLRMHKPIARETLEAAIERAMEAAGG